MLLIHFDFELRSVPDGLLHATHIVVKRKNTLLFLHKDAQTKEIPENRHHSRSMVLLFCSCWWL